MIEAIAKAIYESRNGKGCKAWAHLPKAHQEPYRTDARAAVDAIMKHDPFAHLTGTVAHLNDQIDKARAE